MIKFIVMTIFCKNSVSMYILYITGTSLYDAYHYKKPAMKRSPEYHFAFKLLQTCTKFLTTIRYNKSD